ncbi:MAG TPA: TIGR00730 family Rossman fold protein [Acidimicrobiia bacterium]
MSQRRPRYRTGDPALDAAVADLVTRAGGDANNDLVAEIVATALLLARDGADRGDLKVAAGALRELRHAFSVFAPYRTQRKVAIFGSARTEPDDPLYDQARRVAAAMADRGWMVITGAGPGIMEAGLEGAGPERSFGVSIQLPFEATTSQFIAGDPKLINFRYFFTRKVEFVKEAHAFALLPGGFGTLDEAFELLTLIQTGKSQPAPIVLLDVPDGTYWASWRAFIAAEMVGRGYVSKDDLELVRVTDRVDTAVDEITSFYANYHSQRFVEGRLVIRLHQAPAPRRLSELSREFADIIVRGEGIERIDTTPAELADADHVELDRIAFRFDRRSHARLRMLIDRLNEHRPD